MPLILGFGIVYGYMNFMFIISTIIVGVILPVFPVLIGALITIPILYITKVINKIPILKTILIVLLLVGLFCVFVLIVKIIPRPLGVLEMFYSFVFGVTDVIESVDLYSLFYQNIGNILLGDNIGVNYLIVLGVLFALVGLVVLISMPLYFKLASSSNEHSTEKKRKGENKAERNTFLTFVKKEWLLSVRNFEEFINNYIFLFAMPYVLFVMVGIFTAIQLNLLGVYMTISFSGFIALLMCSASNTASALAITKEGSEFVLLKTVPSDATKMAWAKIFFNLVYSSIMIIVSFVLVIIFCPYYKEASGGKWEWLFNSDWLWYMMIMVLFVNAGLVFWSFQIDIMNPKLREYASSGDTSGINNASKSILIGVLISLLFTVLTLLTLLDTNNMALIWAIIIGVAVIFFIARLYLFVIYLKHVFPYIEY